MDDHLYAIPDKKYMRGTENKLSDSLDSHEQNGMQATIESEADDVSGEPELMHCTG